jgi:hypothetical protein
MFAASTCAAHTGLNPRSTNIEKVAPAWAPGWPLVTTASLAVLHEGRLQP